MFLGRLTWDNARQLHDCYTTWVKWWFSSLRGSAEWGVMWWVSGKIQVEKKDSIHPDMILVYNPEISRSWIRNMILWFFRTGAEMVEENPAKEADAKRQWRRKGYRDRWQLTGLCVVCWCALVWDNCWLRNAVDGDVWYHHPWCNPSTKEVYPHKLKTKSAAEPQLGMLRSSELSSNRPSLVVVHPQARSLKPKKMEKKGVSLPFSCHPLRFFRNMCKHKVAIKAPP